MYGWIDAYYATETIKLPKLLLVVIVTTLLAQEPLTALCLVFFQALQLVI